MDIKAPAMAFEEHRIRHIKLHEALNELVADWIGHTTSMPSTGTVMDLMKWSHEQTINPTPTGVN